MILLIIFLVAFLLVAFFFIKSENAYKNQMKILSGIDKYTENTENWSMGMTLIRITEPYYTTVFRLGDWGYKNILPKEYFELIEPYIE